MQERSRGLSAAIPPEFPTINCTPKAVPEFLGARLCRRPAAAQPPDRRASLAKCIAWNSRLPPNSAIRHRGHAGNGGQTGQGGRGGFTPLNTREKMPPMSHPSSLTFESGRRRNGQRSAEGSPSSRKRFCPSPRTLTLFSSRADVTARKTRSNHLCCSPLTQPQPHSPVKPS